MFRYTDAEVTKKCWDAKQEGISEEMVKRRQLMQDVFAIFPTLKEVLDEKINPTFPYYGPNYGQMIHDLAETAKTAEYRDKNLEDLTRIRGYGTEAGPKVGVDPKSNPEAND